MEIGVKLGPATDPAILETAQQAEALGFHSVWLSERVAVPLDKPHPYKPMADPWIALAFVAAGTRTVKLGTSVSQIALRPPVLMARELATLDRLSGGRVIVGAGAGWVEEEFTSTGVPFATRGGRLAEFVRVLKHLWTRPGEAWEGKHFQIPAVGLIEPLTPGGPPIYLGATSPPGLRRAARFGDGFISTPLPPEALADIRARLLDMRAQAGREGTFPILTQVGPPETPADAEKLVRDYAAAGVDGLILAHAFDSGSGMPAPEAARALLKAAAAA
jgi:probable F420-dependent oxidoreductase